jgi:hypothetical protein
MPSITRRSAPQPDRRSAVEARVLDATQRLDPVLASRVIVIGGDRAMADHDMTNDDTSSDAAFARELASIWWYGAYQRRPEQ